MRTRAVLHASSSRHDPDPSRSAWERIPCPCTPRSTERAITLQWKITGVAAQPARARGHLRAIFPAAAEYSTVRRARLDAAHNLMPRNNGDRGIRQFAIHDVEVGVAHAARQHHDEHTGGPGRRLIGLDRLEAAEAQPRSDWRAGARDTSPGTSRHGQRIGA